MSELKMAKEEWAKLRMVIIKSRNLMVRKGWIKDEKDEKVKVVFT